MGTMPRPKKTKNVDDVVDSLPKQIAELKAQVDAEQAAEAFAEEVQFEEMSLAKFKKQFKEEIQSKMDWLEREDKEGDFKTKKQLKEAALSLVREEHPEITVIE